MPSVTYGLWYYRSALNRSASSHRQSTYTTTSGIFTQSRTPWDLNREPFGAQKNRRQDSPSIFFLDDVHIVDHERDVRSPADDVVQVSKDAGG